MMPDETPPRTGLETLRAMLAGGVSPVSMATTLGFRLVEVADGLAVFESEAGPHLLNLIGVVHGGFALTLIDCAAGCAAYTKLGPGLSQTTIETHTNFTRPILPDSGTLRCVGRVLATGRQIMTAEATLTLPDGRVVAHGGSSMMVLRPRT